MAKTLKLALFLIGSSALAAGAAQALSALVWARLGAAEHEAAIAWTTAHAGLLAAIAIGAGAAYGLLVWLFFEMYVSAPRALADGTRLLTRGNPSHRLELPGAPEVRELAQAINALADERESLRRDVEARIEDAQRKVQEERDRLAAIIAEATQGVLVCNLQGRILLYNARAREILAYEPEGGRAAAGAVLVGLGRPVFGILERSQIAHALETIQAAVEKGAPRPVASFVSALGGSLLRVHVMPVLRGAHDVPEEGGEPGRGDRSITGFVLRIDDVTKPMVAGGRADAVLRTLTEEGRRAVATIRAAVETLLAYPSMEPARQARFVGAIQEEAAALSATLERTERDRTSLTEWLLEEMLGADLVAAVRSRIEGSLGLATAADVDDPGIRLKVDSYDVVRAIVLVAGRLREAGVRELRLGLRAAGRRAHLDLGWSGADVPSATLARWEGEPIDAEQPSLTLRELVERHDGAVWYQASRGAQPGFIRLALPLAEVEQSPIALPSVAGGRPEYYDFDLFHQAGQTPELDERKLTDLAYTVFDTETTGLNPSDGDEIMSIGAVRIVNGRLLRHELFEQLVDPRRPVSLASVRITGIDPQVLAGKPTIGQVLPEFHRFCEETVLVAHNAAFDMRFLQLKEAAAGVRFTHPVLDTLLLAAVIQPNLPSTGLDGIAERFGIPVLGRHTALGDAIMTGEIFLRMIPLLAERGIVTLAQARAASERTLLARVKY